MGLFVDHFWSKKLVLLTLLMIGVGRNGAASVDNCRLSQLNNLRIDACVDRCVTGCYVVCVNSINFEDRCLCSSVHDLSVVNPDGDRYLTGSILVRVCLCCHSYNVVNSINFEDRYLCSSMRDLSVVNPDGDRCLCRSIQLLL